MIRFLGYSYVDNTCVSYKCRHIKKIEVVLSKEFSSLRLEFIGNKLSIKNSLFCKTTCILSSKSRDLKEPKRYLIVYLTDTSKNEKKTEVSRRSSFISGFEICL